MIAMRLAKAGYYAGDPALVMAGRVDHVMALLEYEKFNADYSDAEYELNKS